MNISRRHLTDARAARLFFLIQPITLLICGIVVAVHRRQLLNSLLIRRRLDTIQARTSAM